MNRPCETAPMALAVVTNGPFDGWSSIHAASRRLGNADVILYFGDFDPPGEDMMRSLRVGLTSRGSRPEIVKCALTYVAVQRYRLPADATKVTDSRRAKFVEKWGDVSLELDALPLDVLRDRIVAEVQGWMDLDALQVVRHRERDERRQLTAALTGFAG
jgi:hypothetical protein